MKHLWSLILFSLWLIPLDACTRLFWNEHEEIKLVARTMDLFISDEPEMWIQPKGLHRISQPDEMGMEWDSKFGSVSISAFGNKNFITDGLNESGLSVHMLALKATEYEARDERPGLDYGLWLQYLLDTCTTVKEVLDAHKHFQVVPYPIDDFVWPLHLIVEDAQGDSLILEFIEGKLRVYHGPEYRVCTNDPPYQQQLSLLKKKHSYSLTGTDSISRFVRGHMNLNDLEKPTDTLDGIVKLRSALTPLFQNSPTNFLGKDYLLKTLWSVIVDLKDPTYYFFHEESGKSFYIALSELDFSQEGPQELFSGFQGKEPWFSSETHPLF